MAENHTFLVGNVVEDPELRFTPGGAAVTNFRLAVTPRFKDGDEWKDGDTSFFRVNVWRQQAENVADTLTKGQRVMVSGRLKMRSWETPDGDKRSVVEVEADEVGPSLKFATARVERKSGSGNGGSPAKASSGGQWADPPPF